MLYLPQKRLAVTSSAIVVSTAFSGSPNLSNEEWAQRNIFLAYYLNLEVPKEKD